MPQIFMVENTSKLPRSVFVVDFIFIQKAGLKGKITDRIYLSGSIEYIGHIKKLKQQFPLLTLN